ncbi:MAG: hypothetical protein KatS3mg027_0970 [Bacteroidia bacterium]|nr:MAG: hypothetical protein KatS3mg027_0970 [Bacteroidia bacterium]
MKKWLFSSGVLLLTMSTSFSQNVGINPTGSAPNNSAGLDVDFTNKGLLIPRVALTSATDAATIPSPATSLLVYNTGTGGLSPAGYYYNAGTPGSPNWVQLLPSSSGLSGSGVATRVAFWTGATTLGSNANLYWDNTNNRLGIGTAAPVNRLGVVGGNVGWGTSSEVSVLQNDQGGSIELGGQNGLANPISNGAPYIDFHFGTGSAQDYNARIINAANNRIDITNAGGGILSVNGANIGVGTTSPAQRLDVAGNVQFSGALMPSGNAGTSGQILTSQGPGLPPVWQTPASIPLYGNNAQSVKLTTMQNTTSGTWVNIPGMSITMTPTHNRVYIFASVAARLTNTSGNAQMGQATMYIRVLVNGVEQAISKCVITDFDEDSFGGQYLVTGGSAAIAGVPVNVTIGSPITVVLQWYVSAIWASNPWQLRCDPTLANIGDHAVLTVFD